MYAILYCTVLYCTVLYCTVLYCTVLYCTVLYCTVLYCTVLYCTVLYCDATLPYLTLPYLTLPYLTLPYLTLPYRTLSYPILSYYFTSYHILSHFVSLFAPLLKNEEAEELMRRIEKEEERLSFTEPDKQCFHLCIVNLGQSVLSSQHPVLIPPPLPPLVTSITFFSNHLPSLTFLSTALYFYTCSSISSPRLPFLSLFILFTDSFQLSASYRAHVLT